MLSNQAKKTLVDVITTNRFLFSVVALSLLTIWLSVAFLSSKFQHSKIIETERAAFGKLIDSIGGGWLTVDMEGRIQTWSDNCADISGYSSSEAVGKLVSDFLVLDNSFEQETTIRTKDSVEPVRVLLSTQNNRTVIVVLPNRSTSASMSLL